MAGVTNQRVVLSGEQLRNAFEAATRYLERHRDAINALNVFPVPDGDTGTNMLLTMRSVTEESSREPDPSAGAIMAAMAHGGLLGARGNSGVILSQFFHGLAQGLLGNDEVNGRSLAQAFELASTAAYSSVSKPVDGTMLTVIRELALGASRHVEASGVSEGALSVWEAGLEAAKDALSRTPLQLPVLREAGVVDAGGQGVVTLLEGAFHYLTGENVDELKLALCVPLHTDIPSGDDSLRGALSEPGARPAGQVPVREEYLAATQDDLYGYCTQFLVQGQGMDVDRMRENLSALAESTVVVGNESLARIHVHVHDPGPVFSYAVSLGTIGQVSIDNIDQQHQGFLAFHRGEPGSSIAAPDDISPSDTLHKPGQPPEGQEVATAVIAVAWGEGFIRLFKELGSATVVTGGQTMNPSTQELLDAAWNTGAGEVILLPNNPNIIPAALQAASLAEKTLARASVEGGGTTQGMNLRVIPSRTIPQGVAALLSFNPEGPPESNLESMERAIATVKTIEITRAVRPATVGGIAVEDGQYIGLLEGDLTVAGDSALSALQQALSKVLTAEDGQAESIRHEVLTLYWGRDMRESQVQEAAAQLRESIPGVEVEVVYGGQPFYHYIASLE